MKLIFESVGLVPSRDVSSCRIRTRINTQWGAVYVELIGHESHESNHNGFADFMFYGNTCPTKYSPEFKAIQKHRFPFNQAGILAFVNQWLKTDFTALEVDKSLNVHGTKECFC